MRIGGEAPGGGPTLTVGIDAMSAAGSRHLGLSIGSPRRTPARAPNKQHDGLPEAFQPAGRKMRPSKVSPVVTKRQSAMSSLRANATIIVLRVPRRLSAVRARYHCASALCF